jgi:hypothetical protein
VSLYAGRVAGSDESTGATQAALAVAWAGLPPSFGLACACAMWPPSSRRDAAVRAAAVGADWESFLRVLSRQRTPGLAWAALRAAEISVPAGIAAQLSRQAQGVAARGTALAAEAVRLQRLFDDASIAALVIKGPALAQLAYGEQSLKHGRDIDLLVTSAGAERAYRLLRDEGYAPAAPHAKLTEAQRRLVFRLHKDLELTHPERRLNLELHWRLIDNPVLLRGLGATSPSQEVALPDGRVRTLADADLFAYLAVHGATHCWFRLKWLADLNAWIAGKREAEIVVWYRHAERLGVEACAGQALLLCERLLGYRIPEALAPALTGRRLRRLVAAALDAMVGPDGEIELSRRPWGSFRLLPPQFLRSRGLAFSFAQWRMLTENLDDAIAVPLPRALGFLYPLLRLPLWLLRVHRRRRPAAMRPSRGRL